MLISGKKNLRTKLERTHPPQITTYQSTKKHQQQPDRLQHLLPHARGVPGLDPNLHVLGLGHDPSAGTVAVAEAKAGKDTTIATAEIATTTIVVVGGGDTQGSVERRVGNAESRMFTKEMTAETASRASWMTLTIGGDMVLRTGVARVRQTAAVVVETMIAIIVDRDTGAVVEVLLLVVVVAAVALGPEVPRDLDCTSFSSQPTTDKVHKRARKS